LEKDGMNGPSGAKQEISEWPNLVFLGDESKCRGGKKEEEKIQYLSRLVYSVQEEQDLGCGPITGWQGDNACKLRRQRWFESACHLPFEDLLKSEFRAALEASQLPVSEF
jgi:hypothetical protein